MCISIGMVFRVIWNQDWLTRVGRKLAESHQIFDDTCTWKILWQFISSCVSVWGWYLRVIWNQDWLTRVSRKLAESQQIFDNTCTWKILWQFRSSCVSVWGWYSRVIWNQEGLTRVGRKLAESWQKVVRFSMILLHGKYYDNSEVHVYQYGDGI